MSTNTSDAKNAGQVVPDVGPNDEVDSQAGVVMGYPVAQQPSTSANSGAIVVAGPCITSGDEGWQSNNNQLLHEQNNALLNELRWVLHAGCREDELLAEVTL